MRPRLTVLLIFALSIGSGAVGADETVPLEGAWQDSLLQLYDDAYDQFKDGARDDPGNSREWRFGQAVNLLNVQPRTEANVSRSADLLDDLVAESPDDQIGILSRYYLGRIAQIHRFPPDPGAALAAYRSLLEDHPDHLFAQYGGVKWAITYLGIAPSPEARLQRLFEIDAMAPDFTLAGPAKDLHLFLADGFMRFADDDQRSLEHLLAAAELGIQKRNLRGDVYVRIGETAQLLGLEEIAVEYYRLFLAEFPRDLRTYTIARTVAELEGTP